MSRLVYTGAVMVDLVLAVPHLPQPGGDVLASDYTAHVGGGFTVLAAAGRDGLEGLFAGRTGTGPWSDLVLAALAGEGISSWHAPVPDQDNGICVVLVDDTAERTFITAPGAEEVVSAEGLLGVPVDDDDVVHVSGYSLASASRGVSLAAWVSALPLGPHSPRVVLDPSPLAGHVAADVLAAVLARTNLLTCNAHEAGDLLKQTSSPADRSAHVPGTPPLRDVAGALRSLLPDTASVVVRDGPRGAWVSSPEEADPWHVPAYDVIALDSNGAGDTHTGVLVAALARGATLRSATARANVAAAITVTRPGPATSPTTAEIDAALAGQPFSAPSLAPRTN